MVSQTETDWERNLDFFEKIVTLDSHPVMLYRKCSRCAQCVDMVNTNFALPLLRVSIALWRVSIAGSSLRLIWSPWEVLLKRLRRSATMDSMDFL